jgi:hypothetical protein
MVSRPVRLGVGPRFGANDQILNVFSLTFPYLFMQGALSGERTDLYFAVHVSHWLESGRTRNDILPNWKSSSYSPATEIVGNVS